MEAHMKITWWTSGWPVIKGSWETREFSCKSTNPEDVLVEFYIEEVLELGDYRDELDADEQESIAEDVAEWTVEHIGGGCVAHSPNIGDIERVVTWGFSSEEKAKEAAKTFFTENHPDADMLSEMFDPDYSGPNKPAG
jgi:hypothetical protein